jgi:serine/threonine-protein kinase
MMKALGALGKISRATSPADNLHGLHCGAVNGEQGRTGGADQRQSGIPVAAVEDTAPGSFRPSELPPRRVSWHGLEPGTLVDGTYRVLRPLGEGGMGVVLLAHDERLEREVAIKLIRPEFALSESVRDRFLAEARSMARVRHPNVVEIFAYGELSGSPYFVMEYVPGSTLDAWAKQRGGPPVPVDEALGVLDQVCRGVSAIHATGALHRDLKATNILIGPAFRVVVVDFGLARSVEHAGSAEPYGISGTPEYMAPELFGLASFDPALCARADVYALAVVAYELFTGRMPFPSDNLASLLHQHASSTPAPPSHVHPGLPSVFDAPLLSALEKNPERRTPSAEALRQSLQRAREQSSSPLSRLRILIADDDAQMRALVVRVLGKAFPGAMIEEVPDGASALVAAEREVPSVAVLDLDMPGMNGVELTAALRQSPRVERLPIIVMTGSGTASDWRVLASLGADGFLMKPFNPAQLVTLVRTVLSQGEAGGV